MNRDPRQQSQGGGHDADALNDALSDLAARIARLSVDVLGAVASDHRVGVGLATEAGVTLNTFPDDDLGVMWGALQVAAELEADRLDAARLARFRLVKAGWWNPDGPIARGPFWNDESLASLFDSYPGPSSVPRLAAELVECVARWQAVDRIEAAQRRLAVALRRILLDGENSQPTNTSRPAADGWGTERAA